MRNMKLTPALIVSLLSLIAIQTGYTQGQVVFANSTNTRFLTNDSQGNFGFMAGLNAYRIGLYVGAAGATEDSLQLIRVTTNAPGPFLGRFNGGNPLLLPSEYPAHQPITFQIRVWSLFAGTSFEEALQYPGSAFFGVTALGSAVPSLAPEAPALLFGTDAGQLYGLQYPSSSPQYAALAVEVPVVVPEPSVLKLATIAVLLALVCRRRRAALL